MLEAGHFEIASIFVYVLTLAVVVARWRQKKYLCVISATPFLFLFEYPMMKIVLFYHFSLDFGMLFDRMPWMLIFAHGWFWGLPLLICIGSRASINQIAPELRAVCLYVVFIMWDFLVEYPASLSGLLVFSKWSATMMINRILPAIVPIVVASFSVGLYFVNDNIQEKVKDKGWIRNYVGRIIGYNFLFAVLSLIWATIVHIGISLAG